MSKKEIVQSIIVVLTVYLIMSIHLIDNMNSLESYFFGILVNLNFMYDICLLFLIIIQLIQIILILKD